MFVAFAATIGSMVFSASAQLYELVILDTGGTNESGAYGVNNLGYSCGYQIVNGTYRPCLWTPYRGYIELSTPVGASSPNGIAYAINDWFDMVGTYGTPGSPAHKISTGTATSWIWDGSSFSASAFVGSGTGAHDLNNQGEAACHSTASESSFMYDIYARTIHYTPYVRVPYTFGISDNGNMAGFGIPFNGYFVPVYYRKELNGTYTSISDQTLFAQFGTTGSYDINTNNVVVGATPSTGFVWEPETGLLRILPPNTACFSINGAGIVVGTSNGVAHLWRSGTNDTYVGTDLNTLVHNPSFKLEKAFRINDVGQIVGQGINIDTGIRSAFMLTPATRAPRYMKPHSSTDVELGFKTEIDHVYSFRFSTDLKSWESIPDLFYAEETTNSIIYIPTGDDSTIFIDVLDLTPKRD